MLVFDNRQVYQETVDRLLREGRVPSMGLDTKGLIEALEHGEASTDTAMNLLIHAQAARLLATFAPFGIDEWSADMRAARPRLIEGLAFANELLCRGQASDNKAPAAELTLWIPHFYDLESWKTIPVAPKISETFFYNVFYDFVTIYWFDRADLGRTTTILRERQEDGGLPVWNRLLVAEIVSRYLSLSSELTLSTWIELVDLCGDLIATSDLIRDDYLPDSEGTVIATPKDSAEFWAWQFGRVAALGGTLESDLLDDPELFESWSNGRAALSLMAGLPKDQDWITKRIWTGITTTWGVERESPIAWTDTTESALPEELLSISHSYWIMRLGVANGSELTQASLGRGENNMADQRGSELLLLGSTAELADFLVDAQERAQERRRSKLRDDVMGFLESVWHELPLDCQNMMIEGEHNRLNHRPRDAGLDYANAVEIALRDWLSRPAGEQWDESPGQWARYIRELANTQSNASRVRRQYDFKSSSRLISALELVRDVRKPRAHSTSTPPWIMKTRSAVLGIDQPSIFELLLRFARRWPLKKH